MPPAEVGCTPSRSPFCNLLDNERLCCGSQTLTCTNGGADRNAVCPPPPPPAPRNRHQHFPAPWAWDGARASAFLTSSQAMLKHGQFGLIRKLGQFILLYLCVHLLNLLGGRCRVHSSGKHYLRTASCAHSPKQSLFPSPFLPPPLPTFPDHRGHPFPLAITSLVSVSMCYTCICFYFILFY